MYKILVKNLFIILLVCIYSFGFIGQAFAQQSATPSLQKDEFMKAKVAKIVGEKKNPYSDYDQTFQILKLQILDGNDSGKTVQVNYDPQKIADLKLQKGDTVVLIKTYDTPTKTHYTISDKYRLVPSELLVLFFMLLVIIIAGWKGVGSIIGLGISLAIIFLYVVPQILAGQDPLVICMIGSIGILLLTTYIAHGFSKQTTIALISTFIALICTFFISIVISKLALITGYGEDNARTIHFGTQHLINVRGLLLGGIIIGTLGALNDVTTTQAATMFQLANVSNTFTFRSLIKQGFLVGREHVISIINTLVLAYAGSSIAVFIFIFYNSSYYPIWVILNSELLNEELIRTIAGTIGLILVVPIVTLLAGFFLYKRQLKV